MGKNIPYQHLCRGVQVRSYLIPNESLNLTDKLVYKCCAKAIGAVVVAADGYFGENVFVTSLVTPWVNVDHCTRDVKEGDHLFNALRYNQGVRLARRLEHIGTRCRRPIVFEVPPAAAEHKTVHRRRVAVASQHSGSAHSQQIHPIALRGIQAQRSEPDGFHLRDPDPFIVRKCVRRDNLGLGVDGKGELVRHPIFVLRIAILIDGVHLRVLEVVLAVSVELLLLLIRGARTICDNDGALSE